MVNLPIVKTSLALTPLLAVTAAASPTVAGVSAAVRCRRHTRSTFPTIPTCDSRCRFPAHPALPCGSARCILRSRSSPSPSAPSCKPRLTSASRRLTSASRRHICACTTPLSPPRNPQIRKGRCKTSMLSGMLFSRRRTSCR